MTFQGKCAVVTGGANGIGLAMARALAARDARVWIFDLEREDPAGVAAGFGARGVVVDVACRDSLTAGFAQSGPPDVLMVNAGATGFGDFDATPRELWDRILSVNLTGAMLTMQTAAALMKPRRKGSIVLTASTNSFDGEAFLAAYNASKAGVIGLLHTIANELGPWQIRVNAICPGLIRTRLTTRFFDHPEVVREYFRDVPLGRGGETEEVANAAVFLASDLASYITGTTLTVDGGQLAAKFGTWNENHADFDGQQWRLR